MTKSGAESSSQSAIVIPTFGVFEQDDPSSLLQQFVRIHANGMPHEQSNKINQFMEKHRVQFAKELGTIANGIDAYFHHNYQHLENCDSEAAFDVKVKKFYVWRNLIDFIDFCLKTANRNSKEFEFVMRLGAKMVDFAAQESLILPKMIERYRLQQLSQKSYLYYIYIMDMSSVLVGASGNIEAKFSSVLNKREPGFLARAIAMVKMYIDSGEFVCEFELNEAASALLTVGVNLLHSLEQFTKNNPDDHQEVESLTAYYRAAAKRLEDRKVPPFLEDFKNIQNVLYKQWKFRNLDLKKGANHKSVEQKIAAFEKLLNAKTIDYKICYKNLQSTVISFVELNASAKQKVAEKLQRVLKRCHSGLMAQVNSKKAHHVVVMICDILQVFITDIENDLANQKLAELPLAEGASASTCESLPVASLSKSEQVAAPAVSAPVVIEGVKSLASLSELNKLKQEEASQKAQASIETTQQGYADEIQALQRQIEENHKEALKEIESQLAKRLKDLENAHNRELKDLKDKQLTAAQLANKKQKLIAQNEEAVSAAKKTYRKQKEEYKTKIESQNMVVDKLKQQLTAENEQSRVSREQFLQTQKELLSKLNNTVQMLKADIVAVKVKATAEIAAIEAKAQATMTVAQQSLSSLHDELVAVTTQARATREQCLQEAAAQEQKIANHIQQAKENIAAAKAQDNSDIIKRTAISDMQPLNLALYDIPEIEPYIPDVVKYMMEEFSEAGVECYIVGGFVRDHLSGVRKISGDVDIVINGAIPSHMQNRFKPTGDKQCFKRGNVDVRCDRWDNNNPQESFAKLRESALISVNTFFCTHLGKVYDPFNAITHVKSPYLHFVGSFATLENNSSLILRIVNARTKFKKKLHDTHWDEIVRYIDKLKSLPFAVWLKHVGDLFLNDNCEDNFRFLLAKKALFRIIPLTDGFANSPLVFSFWNLTLTKYIQAKEQTSPYHVIALFIMLSVLAKYSLKDSEQHVENALNAFISHFESTAKHSFTETTRPILNDLLKQFNFYKLAYAATQSSSFTPGFTHYCQAQELSATPTVRGVIVDPRASRLQLNS